MTKHRAIETGSSVSALAGPALRAHLDHDGARRGRRDDMKTEGIEAVLETHNCGTAAKFFQALGHG